MVDFTIIKLNAFPVIVIFYNNLISRSWPFSLSRCSFFWQPLENINLRWRNSAVIDDQRLYYIILSAHQLTYDALLLFYVLRDTVGGLKKSSKIITKRFSVVNGKCNFISYKLFFLRVGHPRVSFKSHGSRSHSSPPFNSYRDNSYFVRTHMLFSASTTILGGKRWMMRNRCAKAVGWKWNRSAPEAERSWPRPNMLVTACHTSGTWWNILRPSCYCYWSRVRGAVFIIAGLFTDVVIDHGPCLRTLTWLARIGAGQSSVDTVYYSR